MKEASHPTGGLKSTSTYHPTRTGVTQKTIPSFPIAYTLDSLAGHAHLTVHAAGTVTRLVLLKQNSGKEVGEILGFLLSEDTSLLPWIEVLRRT